MRPAVRVVRDPAELDAGQEPGSWHGAILKVTAASLVFSFVAFLMVEVLIVYAFRENIAEEPNFVVFAALLVLFNVVAVGVSIGVFQLFEVRVYWALPLAFVANLFLWVDVAWAVTLLGHPETVGQLTGTDWIVGIPQYVAILAVYHLADPIWLWVLNIASFHAFLLLFQYDIMRRYEKKNG